METLYFRECESLNVINDEPKLIKEDKKILNVSQRKLLKS